VDQGQGQLLHHLISGFRILHRSANEVDRMLHALSFLDKHDADGVVGGCDVH